jgi:hypothetical protein
LNQEGPAERRDFSFESNPSFVVFFQYLNSRKPRHFGVPAARFRNLDLNGNLNYGPRPSGNASSMDPTIEA